MWGTKTKRRKIFASDYVIIILRTPVHTYTHTYNLRTKQVRVLHMNLPRPSITPPPPPSSDAFPFSSFLPFRHVSPERDEKERYRSISTRVTRFLFHKVCFASLRSRSFSLELKKKASVRSFHFLARNTANRFRGRTRGGQGVKAVPAILVEMAPWLFSRGERNPAGVPADYFQNWVGVQFWREKEKDKEGKRERERDTRENCVVARNFGLFLFIEYTGRIFQLIRIPRSWTRDVIM